LAIGDINENGFDPAIKNRHNEMVTGNINGFYDGGY
jgi:hypothetical protein